MFVWASRVDETCDGSSCDALVAIIYWT